MFDFSYDPDENLLRLVQQGYWSLADFHAFESEFVKLHTTIRKVNRNYRVLADCREFPVQSPEISEAFGQLFAIIMDENKGRYAIVVGSILNKLQAKRALPQPHVQAFTDTNEAMAWLSEDSSKSA